MSELEKQEISNQNGLNSFNNYGYQIGTQNIYSSYHHFRPIIWNNKIKINEQRINNQDISKSIGGNSSKIHLAVDSNGNPIEFIISDGTSHDIKIAPDLVSKLDLTESEILCADKGYDSDNFRTQIEQTKTKSNIPRKSNTKSNNDHMDWHIYKIRHLVENSFCRLKQFRGISTRYDKLKRNYQSAVALACIFIWLPL